MSGRKNIALFMGIMENEYCSAIMDGALEGARDNDVNIIVFPMDLINATYDDQNINMYRYQYNILDSYMDANHLDGVIIEYGTIVSALDEAQRQEFLRNVGDKRCVLLCDTVEGYTCITVDNTAGLVEVIEHMIMVHKLDKIGYLSGTKDNADAEERLTVFKETMKKHNLYLGDDWIEYGNFSIYIEEQVKALVNRHPDIQAIVCANDSMAAGAATALRKMGMEPGKDIFLTGFDDTAISFLNEPAITTVNADPQKMAYTAVEVLCKPEKKPEHIKIKTHMVCRESCGCIEYNKSTVWQQRLGLSADWRQIAQAQLSESEDRRGLEHELGNVTREMVFAEKTETQIYDSILKTLRRLQFYCAGLYLYDSFITHQSDYVWKNPDDINLVGYYMDFDNPEYVTYPIGERKIRTEDLFGIEILQDGKRHDFVVIPLFFGDKQIGLLITESEPKRFLYAYDISGQISNALNIIAMNNEQERMKAELEEANKSKSRFLANMSHEIRTPINAIIGFNEMIFRESNKTEVLDYSSDVKRAADLLLLLVNDVLDFSKIEAGKMELIIAEYYPYELVKSVIDIISPKAESKGLSIITDVASDLPVKIMGDSGRISQILINLLSNAVKYTTKGTVTLKVNGQITDNRVKLLFSVKDTGIGIREEDIERLFHEFERIDEKKYRNIEGTGLGINITNGLLNLMGSKLRVNSEYGIGSEFFFELDQAIYNPECDSIKNDETEKYEETIELNAPGVRLLVVDDNFLNRKVIINLLKETQMEVDSADSGVKCLEMINENTYDLILLDIMMPEMDGVETLENILQNKLFDIKKTPVIALTANAITGAKEEYLEKGFSDYLTKPVLPHNLYKMIKKYIPVSE